jgi:hypothetical protein
MVWRRGAAIAVAGILAAAGLAAWAVAGLSGSSSGRGSAAAGPAKPGAFTSVQEKRLEQGITAPGIAAEAAVVAPQVRAQFVSRGRALLPAGSRLSIDAKSFHATRTDTATADATVSGPDAGRWQLLLIRQGGQWLLLDSRKLS